MSWETSGTALYRGYRRGGPGRPPRERPRSPGRPTGGHLRPATVRSRIEPSAPATRTATPVDLPRQLREDLADRRGRAGRSSGSRLSAAATRPAQIVVPRVGAAAGRSCSRRIVVIRPASIPKDPSSTVDQRCQAVRRTRGVRDHVVSRRGRESSSGLTPSTTVTSTSLPGTDRITLRAPAVEIAPAA